MGCSADGSGSAPKKKGAKGKAGDGAEGDAPEPVKAVSNLN